MRASATEPATGTYRIVVGAAAAYPSAELAWPWRRASACRARYQAQASTSACAH